MVKRYNSFDEMKASTSRQPSSDDNEKFLGEMKRVMFELNRRKRKLSGDEKIK